jgi:ubiquinone/menaquinone biosynthesis C-methylase UbiE
MKNTPSNIYEAQVNLDAETERLRNFTWPTAVSVEIIGEIKPGTSVLDVGAGSNTGLGDYVRSHGGTYVALDKNTDFLEQQRIAGATIIEGDVRQMPVENHLFDICHVRFVLAHLGSDKLVAIRNIFDATKDEGKAVFMDYDWNEAHGSDAFNALRDLFIGDMLFDAGFGADLQTTIKTALQESGVTYSSKRFSHEKMFDYAQILNLRNAASTDLKVQNAAQSLINHCDAVFDNLKLEAEMDEPPGFHFPDIVAITVAKSR